MKSFKNALFYAAMAFALFSVSSCSKDDDPKGVEKTETKTYVYKIPIEGIKGSAQTPAAVNLNLSSIIGSDNAKNFIKSSIQYRDCYLKVDGLIKAPEDTKIQDLKIKIGNGAFQTIGTFAQRGKAIFPEKESETVLQENEDIKIVQDLLTELGSKKTASVPVSITFTPTETIVQSTIPVYLEISVSAVFTYKVFE
jgi:hypothetical protein